MSIEKSNNLPYNSSFGTQNSVLGENGSNNRRFHAGYLNQRTISVGIIKSWKKRYFRLRDDAILCYKTKDHLHARFEIYFTDHTMVTWHLSKPSSFEISHVDIVDRSASWYPPEDPIILQANHDAERNEWMALIRGKLENRKWKKKGVMESPRCRTELMNTDSVLSPDCYDENVPKNSNTISDRSKSMSKQVRKVVGNIMNRRRSASTESDKFHSKYLMSKEIGEGSFSVVRQATNRSTGEVYAVKCTKPTDSLQDEIEILRQLSHPNVIGLHEFYDCGDMCYVVMDYMRGGDLCDKLIELKKFSDNRARTIIAKATQGLKYCHELNVIHRDIKPENILLDGSHVKLADFGLAKQLKDKSDTLIKTCGTPEYAAPELLEGQPYGIESDIFSLGVVMYILLVGTFPFSIESANALQHLERFSEGKDVRNMNCLAPDAVHWHGVNESAKELVLRMLEPDPKLRITANEILLHPWIESSVISLEESLIAEERRRKDIRYEGFKNLLEAGITIIKHGRKGTPHTTKLQMTRNYIQWQSKIRVIRPSAFNNQEPIKNGKMTNEVCSSDINVRLESTKDDGRSSSPLEEEVRDGILLRDIHDVLIGHQTDVFKRNDNDSDSSLCFSLICTSRTLDLEATSIEQKEWLVQGFQQFVLDQQLNEHPEALQNEIRN